MSYDLFAICAVVIGGVCIVIWQAVENYDSRPLDAEDFPEVDTRPDQRFRQADGQ